jgi:hypothetical protein
MVVCLNSLEQKNGLHDATMNLDLAVLMGAEHSTFQLYFQLRCFESEE